MTKGYTKVRLSDFFSACAMQVIFMKRSQKTYNSLEKLLSKDHKGQFHNQSSE